MHPHLPPAAQQFHRTTTFAASHHPVWPHVQLPPGPDWAHAVCRCGWAECAESRHDARVLARHHRRFAPRHMMFHPGWACRIGERDHQADATGVHVSITGQHHGWALADGIGDHVNAAHAAAHAAAKASYVAAEHGAVAGLLAAAETLPGGAEDTVMVVVTPLPSHEGGGWDIAWVGSCRAYEYRADTEVLTQLTEDHTRGQELRTALAHSSSFSPGELEKLAAANDRIVTSSVATATPSTLGHTTTRGRRHRLLLTSDGIHNTVPHRSLARAAATFTDPATRARKLTLAARYFGGTDNATALVIDPTSDSEARA
ncbi:hypothetical protein L3Q67_01690 [Saccharothrix sp. AJ9571]|nr:hypothetical protein L3Q67_01690 [Saccharothrix sp. AJ9571]